MGIASEERNSYYKRVEKALPVSAKDKKKIMVGLQNGIEEYLEDHPEATLEDVQNHFGEPDSIAAEYLPELKPEELKHFARRKKVIIGLSLGIFALIIVFALIYAQIIQEEPGVIKETSSIEETTSGAIIVEEI